MLVLNSQQVRRALPMRQAILAMKEAFAALCQEKADVPQRAALPIRRHDGVTLVMPAYLDDAVGEALAVKVVSVFEHNAERGLARIQAAVLVLDPQTGTPTAVMEGATLTGIRTAAASGAATDLLARKGARALAILGAGVQARSHLEAVCTVRDIQTAWIYSPTRGKVDALIAELAGRGDVPRDLRAAASAAEAVCRADVVCCTTTSARPVFDDADLSDGAHVNAVGSYQRHVCEVPAETVVRALVVVDSRAAAWQEAGDLIGPLEAGLIDHDHIHAELGELVLGRKRGRQNDEQLTLFKSVGLAVQDAAAARVALANAQRLGLGQQVEW